MLTGSRASTHPVHRLSHFEAFWTVHFLKKNPGMLHHWITASLKVTSWETAAVFLTAQVSRGEKSPVEVSTTRSASRIAPFEASVPVSILHMLVKPLWLKTYFVRNKSQAHLPTASARNRPMTLLCNKRIFADVVVRTGTSSFTPAR